MALTFRTNGVAGGLVSADWWNSYYNLFTGSMTDQWVRITNGLTLKAVSTSPSAPTLALASGTSLGIGAYTYAVSFLIGDGESMVGTTATITTTTGNQVVSLSNIPTGPAGTVSRRLYRSLVGTASPFFLVSTIGDNSTTTYTDTVADGSLGFSPQTHGSFGGSLVIADPTGNHKLQLYNDGAIWADAGALSTDGNGLLSMVGAVVGSGLLNLTPHTQAFSGTTGTATLYEYTTGANSLKVIVLNFNNYRNAGAAHNFGLHQALSIGAMIFSSNIFPVSFLAAGTAQSCPIITSLASAGGTIAAGTVMKAYSIGQVFSAIDTIQELGGQSSGTSQGPIILIGV